MTIGKEVMDRNGPSWFWGWGGGGKKYACGRNGRGEIQHRRSRVLHRPTSSSLRRRYIILAALAGISKMCVFYHIYIFIYLFMYVYYVVCSKSTKLKVSSEVSNGHDDGRTETNVILSTRQSFVKQYTSSLTHYNSIAHKRETTAIRRIRRI